MNLKFVIYANCGVVNCEQLLLFDPDMAKPWDEKISHEDRVVDGKTIHVFFC